MDITKCCASNCEYSSKCFRYKASQNSQWQSWCDFSVTCKKDNGFDKFIAEKSIKQNK